MTPTEAEKLYRKHTMGEVMVKIEEWALEKGLNDSNTYVQLAKLMEETGELAEGIIKDRDDQIADSLGDIFVVITILAMQLKLDIDQCAKIAYDEIKDRRGLMINGSFIKEEDIPADFSITLDGDDDFLEYSNPLFWDEE